MLSIVNFTEVKVFENQVWSLCRDVWRRRSNLAQTQTSEIYEFIIPSQNNMEYIWSPPTYSEMSFNPKST